MTVLGIDFGVKRVGVAVSNPDKTMAFPVCTIQRTTRDALFERLLELIEEKNVERIVLGLPQHLDGSDSLTTRQVRNFAASLGRRTDVPIEFIDEALSSAHAEALLDTAGVRGQKKKRVLDQQAAVVILESYLTSFRSMI
ncbi:Holliday junction resolvase RuvX [Desulfovibrio inopinatus]|uniref:Holliday junction resolvase RuvX n=1 Tax=Desulfovibrio inopinatus TaxID=102109 RepID=UPI00041643CB|nr:Holliday junction resolvase RuvX [Desulfovibrio inopinatus]